MQEPRAKSQEPRAKSQEPRAKSQEPRAKSQEPRAKSQEPRAKSQEPRAKSQENYDTPLGFVKPPRLLVTIPTYNEAENIELFIKTVFENIPDNAEILVIDDNSPDGTAKLVESLIPKYHGRLQILKRAGKQGGASAFLLAFLRGLERGFDACLAMDADFSHDPKYIPAILEAGKNHDVVIGSRLIQGGYIENYINCNFGSVKYRAFIYSGIHPYKIG